MSLRSAINAMCKYCIHDPKAGGKWRQQVEACTSYNCPLYHVRPVSIKRPDEESEPEIEENE